MFNNQIIAGSSGQGGGSFYPYSIDQSLRFDGSSAYLSKNDFGTSTDVNKRTFSTWIKQSKVSFTTYDSIICAAASGIEGIIFEDTEKIGLIENATTYFSDALFRDPIAWYHIFFTFDHSAGEFKLYINGSLEKGISGATTSTMNKLMNTGHLTTIMKRSNASQYISGYLAETVALDGYIGDINDFAEEINGIWVPKNISAAGLTFGANGFYLDYADSSDLGKDVSGQGNHFTSNSLAAEDQVPDSPTGNNFATFNPLDNDLYNAPSEGNLRALTAGNNGTQAATFAVSSGKWYFEVRNGTAGSGSLARMVGIIYDYAKISGTSYNDSNKFVYYSATGTIRNNSNVTYGDSWQADGDIIGVALDLDNGAMYFSKNGTWQNSATAAEIAAGTTTNAAFTGLSGTFKPIVAKTGGTSSNDPHDANFGQDPSFHGNLTGGDVGTETDENGIGLFKYAPPSGFLAMCSANLPEVTIGPNSAEQADDYFNTVLYTGGSGDNVVTGVGFQPDFVWLKGRNEADAHVLTDSVRGATKTLKSSSTDAETTSAEDLQSFDSDGFTTGTNDRVGGLNDTMVAWNWKAGGTAVSNTDGSITSQVSAAPDAGFSVVTYSGTLSGTGTASVGHGLGVRPNMVIAKSRNVSGADSGEWVIWHDNLSTDNYVLRFDTAAESNKAGNGDMSSLFTTTTFGTNYTSGLNVTGNNYVAYCFANVEGHLKCGSYVGNGSADGPFVYTGHRVKWLMVKNINNAATSWWIMDTERSTFNVMNDFLFPNLSNAESASTVLFADFLSNGFKIRNGTYGETNASGNTYIYLAFAEQPFKYANAR